jgi:hypothetical protein
VHRDGKVPNGTITFAGREAEFGTLFGHTGAFYFKDTDGVITPEGEVSGVLTSDGGIPGFEDFHAKSRFFPTPNASVSGNLSHTADHAIQARFGEA